MIVVDIIVALVVLSCIFRIVDSVKSFKNIDKKKAKSAVKYFSQIIAILLAIVLVVGGIIYLIRYRSKNPLSEGDKIGLAIVVAGIWITYAIKDKESN